ncbi:MAG TPA: FAD-dependent oxidoreductase [Myxococcota bacterium]|nr:FAD-dependent oxidoreductase [Myxococcota bacterium]
MAGIAVVGGGIAGLACAWRLARAGHEALVLERASAPGGRMRSMRRGDFLLDLGTPCFAQSDSALRIAADALGLADAIRPFARGRDAWMQGGALRPLGRESASAIAGAAGALRLARTRRRLLERRVDPSRLLSLERARLSTEIARDAEAAALSWLPAPQDAPPALLRAISALRQGWSGAELASFEGGSGALASALAARLRVRGDCHVRRVETFTGGARLAFTERGVARTLDADAVVVAVPGSRVTGLCPKLTPEERGFFESVRYAPALVVFLAFARVPSAALRSVFVAPEEGLELSALVLEHLRPGAAPHGAGLVRALLSPDASLRMHRAPDASIADLAVENLAYGRFGAPRPCDYAVQRHPDAWPRFAAADVRRLARFLQRFERSPRLAFAGDYLTAPSADAALASGLRAAAELEGSL